MARIVVAGGTGYFGRAAVALLRAQGESPVVAARHGGDVRIDVEDLSSIRESIRSGDVVLDLAGPFQRRTTTLVEAAVDVGFHLIDIADALGYAQKVETLRGRIEAAGIAVLTSCSSLSAVSAALVRRSGIALPERATAFLAPATRHTANPATAASALASVGRPIRVLREGRLVDDVGWRETRSFEFPPPVGRVRGFRNETCDAVHLPRIWPSLRTVDFWVDPNAFGLGVLLGAAAKREWVRRIVERTAPVGLAIARAVGSGRGVFGVEVEGGGRIFRQVLVGGDRAQWTAVGPAVRAAREIASGRFGHSGLVAHDLHVDPDALFASLRGVGIELLEA